jgi:hypothetical protein
VNPVGTIDRYFYSIGGGDCGWYGLLFSSGTMLPRADFRLLISIAEREKDTHRVNNKTIHSSEESREKKCQQAKTQQEEPTGHE